MMFSASVPVFLRTFCFAESRTTRAAFISEFRTGLYAAFVPYSLPSATSLACSSLRPSTRTSTMAGRLEGEASQRRARRPVDDPHSGFRHPCTERAQLILEHDVA